VWSWRTSLESLRASHKSLLSLQGGARQGPCRDSHFAVFVCHGWMFRARPRFALFAALVRFLFSGRTPPPAQAIIDRAWWRWEKPARILPTLPRKESRLARGTSSATASVPVPSEKAAFELRRTVGMIQSASRPPGNDAGARGSTRRHWAGFE